MDFKDFYIKTLRRMMGFTKGIEVHRKNMQELGREGHSAIDVPAREAVVVLQAQIDALDRGLMAVAAAVGRRTTERVNTVMEIIEPSFGCEPDDLGMEEDAPIIEDAYSKGIATFQFALERQCKVWFVNNDFHVIRHRYEPDRVTFITRSAAETAQFRHWLIRRVAASNVTEGRNGDGSEWTTCKRIEIEMIVGVKIPEKKVDTSGIEPYFDETWADLIKSYTQVELQPGQIRWFGTCADDAWIFIEEGAKPRGAAEDITALANWMRSALHATPAVSSNKGILTLKVKYNELAPRGFEPKLPIHLQARAAADKVMNDESDTEKEHEVVDIGALRVFLKSLLRNNTDEQIEASIKALIKPKTNIEHRAVEQFKQDLRDIGLIAVPEQKIRQFVTELAPKYTIDQEQALRTLQNMTSAALKPREDEQ